MFVAKWRKKKGYDGVKMENRFEQTVHLINWKDRGR